MFRHYTFDTANLKSLKSIFLVAKDNFSLLLHPFFHGVTAAYHIHVFRETAPGQFLILNTAKSLGTLPLLRLKVTIASNATICCRLMACYKTYLKLFICHYNIKVQTFPETSFDTKRQTLITMIREWDTFFLYLQCVHLVN